MRLSLGLLLLLSVGLVGCGGDGFPKVEALSEFRILAVVASAPEVAPGGSASVVLYVSDPKGAGRTVTGTYDICLDPGISFGATPSCAGVPGATSGSYSIDFSTDSDLAANFYTGSTATAVTVTVPATILSGRDSRAQFNGVAMIIVFTFVVDGKTVTAFRRISATNRGSLNANPAAPTALLNGGAFASVPRKGQSLSLLGVGDEETYSYRTVDGSTETRQESYEVAWFTSSGELDRAKVGIRDSVKFKKGPSATGPYVSVAVVRDERGGVAVRRVYIP